MRSVLVLALAAVAFVSGPCRSDDQDSHGEVLHANGATILVGFDDGRNIAGVGLGGTVAVVDGCLGIGHAVVIWPPGTKVVADDPITISIHGFGTVKVGDQVIGGGALYRQKGPSDGPRVPARCSNARVESFFPEDG